MEGGFVDGGESHIHSKFQRGKERERIEDNKIEELKRKRE